MVAFLRGQHGFFPELAVEEVEFFFERTVFQFFIQFLPGVAQSDRFF